jgi:hypothetical protein
MFLIRSKNDLFALLKELDRRLSEPLEVHVIGGANLIATGASSRPTADIDVICPVEFPPRVRQAVEEIANKKGIPPKWLNTMPSPDLRFLATGWKERSSLVFSGNVWSSSAWAARTF